MISTKLPSPTQDALNISQQLLAQILSQIKANNGKISFAEYMKNALYAQGLGYYCNGTQKFGKNGDFVTAPELSPLFSQCLAKQCQQVLHNLTGGDILEVGAGSGIMAANILLELQCLNSLPTHYYILELSASLKEEQQKTINTLCPTLLSRISWLTKLPEFGFKGIILGNEVLDAMPVCRFVITEDSIQEICVIDKNNQLQCEAFATNQLELIELYHSQHWPFGYTSEINLLLKPWIASLADILEKGVILLIDYGFPKAEYYHADRKGGTLMCHYRHYAHQDPFLYPGLQDITAHVDFTAIAEAALNASLDVLGYCAQAPFLLSTGLIEYASLLNNIANNELQKENILQNQAINMLTSPAEMGELFKVIALGRHFEEPLMGFSLNDRRYAL